MNKRLAILGFLILWVSPAWAAMAGPGMGLRMGYGYGLGACADPELHLSRDQAEKIDRLQNRYLMEMRRMQRELVLKRAEWGLLHSGGAEEDSLRKRKEQEIRSVREKMRETWMDYKMKCQALLSDEQLEERLILEKRPGQRTNRGRWFR